MKKHFLWETCLVAMFAFTACGDDEKENEEKSEEKSFCQKFDEKTTGTEYKCADTLKSFGTCSNQYINAMTCLLDSGSFHYSDTKELVRLIKNRCPAQYLPLEKCAQENSRVMTVSAFCDKNKRTCGYVTELFASCTEDYGKKRCSEQYATYMDCLITNTSAQCVDDALKELTEQIQDQANSYCMLSEFSYNACIE